MLKLQISILGEVQTEKFGFQWIQGRHQNAIFVIGIDSKSEMVVFYLKIIIIILKKLF